MRSLKSSLAWETLLREGNLRSNDSHRVNTDGMVHSDRFHGTLPALILQP